MKNECRNEIGCVWSSSSCDLVLHLSDYTERKKQQTNDKCDVGYELFKQWKTQTNWNIFGI